MSLSAEKNMMIKFYRSKHVAQYETGRLKVAII